uniref:Reticulon n=1 Tax=Xiphophorus couchianus TaxID=32473 RepID=A0A3B5L4F8_9TELE
GIQELTQHASVGGAACSQGAVDKGNVICSRKFCRGTAASVNDLIHWRDPKKSGVVFGLSLLLLLSLAAFSVISVVSYMLLALLCVTITFRIYKSVVQAVQKSTEGHPFRELIEKDVTIPPETFRKHVDTSLTHINRALKQMSRLFLVEDLVDSLKLAVVMWMLTYVGAVFNGITILILADILLFAVPPVYEKNKIDAVAVSSLDDSQPPSDTEGFLHPSSCGPSPATESMMSF